MRWIAAVLLVAAGGCAEVRGVDPEELMDADRTFAADTAELGTAGWVGTFAEDGKLVSGSGVVEGRGAVEEAMGSLDSSGYSLSWEPEFAEGSGDLGYTYGSYRRESLDDGGETLVETGRYVTIWRRDATGRWKVALDIGSAAP